MLCYKDRTFYAAQDCQNMDCDRNTRNSKVFHPDEFWDNKVCVADLQKTCTEYKKEEPKDVQAD